MLVEIQSAFTLFLQLNHRDRSFAGATKEIRFTADEERQRYLKLPDAKFLLVTNIETTAQEVMTHCKRSPAIERGFRALKSNREIGPVNHRVPQRIHANAMTCFIALALYRVMRTRVKAGKTAVSLTHLLEQLKRIQQQTVQFQDGNTKGEIIPINAHQKNLSQHSNWQFSANKAYRFRICRL